jgi:transposase
VTDELSIAERLALSEKALAQRDAELAAKNAVILKLTDRITVLETHLRRLLRGRFTPSSETLIHDPGQESLDLGVLPPPTHPAPLMDVPDSPNVAPRPRRRARRRSLSAMYPELIVDPKVIDLDPEQKVDSDGTPLVRMGFETSESLVWEPKAPFIRRWIRLRYGRSDTGEKIAIAPVPDRITPKGILADETIHAVVISHVLDALPWHRQEVMSDRVGCRISRSVLCAGWAAWSELMAPLAAAIRDSVLAQPVIGADSTVMPHQDGSLPLQCRKTALWGVTDGHAAFFQWTQDQRHERAVEVLGAYAGVLLRDEWGGWKHIATETEDPNKADDSEQVPQQAGCHAHARRRFVDLEGMDKRADSMLALYRDFYRAEAEAVQRARDMADLVRQRRIVRSLCGQGLWEKILALAQAITAQDAPSTAIYRAGNYIVKYQDSLAAFLSDGRLPVDNNLTENVLRIVALLRKNRLFLGKSPEAGPRLAIGLTVLRSCVMAQVNPLRYLEAVTPTLLEHRRLLGLKLPGKELASLIPRRWREKNIRDRLGTSSIAQAG